MKIQGANVQKHKTINGTLCTNLTVNKQYNLTNAIGTDK